MFHSWVKSKSLGIMPVGLEEFLSSDTDAILDASDKSMMEFASQEFGYKRNKGLDFLARFNGKYIIGEAKFITDFGGHQNAQFLDAMSTLTDTNIKAIPVAIIDGVPYIKSNNKMYKQITATYNGYNIMSRKFNS